MHQREPPIIHRDVRIRNILLGSDGNYKICNFGNSTKNTFSAVTQENFSRVQSDILNNTRETHRAPEQLDLHSTYPINEKVDVWALAVVLYSMMFFRMPFSKVDKSNQIEGIVSFPQTKKYSVQLQRLCKKLFEPNPKKRPSMSEIYRCVESLQTKANVTNVQRQVSKGGFSDFEEDKNDDNSSDDDLQKYKTAQDTLIDDNDAFKNIKRVGAIEGSDKDFTGFATKMSASLSKNGTKGWVLYATENSSFPPQIQYI
jgi:serine/threonine protein kinase